MRLTGWDSSRRPLNDPSYEPKRLYRLFGKPNLAGGMAIVVAGALFVGLVLVALRGLAA